MIVTKYSEQQVGAAMNLLTLSKWSEYIGASLVEPFVNESEFRLPILTFAYSYIKHTSFQRLF